jgi:hypothetical protein
MAIFRLAQDVTELAQSLVKQGTFLKGLRRHPQREVTRNRRRLRSREAGLAIFSPRGALKYSKQDPLRMRRTG